jgi:thymidylate synthase ThyX
LKKASKKEKLVLMKALLGKLDRWDVPIRALEFAGDYLVEYAGMTYGDWREYKRHRMQSYVAKDLDIKWGYMVPPLAVEMDQSENSEFHGSVEMIKKVMDEVAKLFKEVAKVDPVAARYCVTRLHYRPAVAKFNVRELFHLMKLRTSGNAHPFIRRLMWPLFDQIKKVNPLIAEHLQIRLEKDKRPSRDSMWSY